ncbi:MAG: PDZ domain-containing protein [Planctomycetota bacterium]|nr:PDZ domain-containing protein [Planctomycetota bacterium]
MNVPTIKLVCWLASLSSLGGLAKYAYDWFGNIEDRRNPIEGSSAFPLTNEDHDQVSGEHRDRKDLGPMSKAEIKSVAAQRYVTRILEEDQERATEVAELVVYDQLKVTFKEMSWTGKPPEKKPDKVDEGPKAPPRQKPISEVVAIIMMRYDTFDPGGSVAEAIYKKERTAATLKVGMALKKPYDYAVVHSIKPEAVIFAFKDPEREFEELATSVPERIVMVGEGGVQSPRKDPLPTGKIDKAGSAETTMPARNLYELGYKDMESFANDYQRILTEDITTATYMKDGVRAGIEIKSVKADSIAARHGAQAGDILISINGKKVTSEAEAVSYVKDNQDKYTAWEVKVLRFGKEETQMYYSPEN